VAGAAEAGSAVILEVGADSEASVEATLEAAERTATGNVYGRGAQLEEKLSELVRRLKSAFGDRLVSVVLYGSAAMGDWHEQSSDLNVLCVLDRLSRPELAQSEAVFRWWRQQGNPPPLLMNEEELRASTDCFPMEFHDMQEHRRVLYGPDAIQNLHIDPSFYRAQVEHELRAKQIRLRQKAAEILSRPGQLLNLLTDSISTFCVLGRHALILSGHEPRWKKTEIVAALEQAIGIPFEAANAILAVRTAGKRRAEVDAVSLFDKYLTEMDSLVRFVNGLER
jgi:hypothetical protein